MYISIITLGIKARGGGGGGDGDGGRRRHRRRRRRRRRRDCIRCQKKLEPITCKNIWHLPSPCLRL